MKRLTLVLALLVVACTVAFAQAEARAGQFGIQTSVAFTTTDLALEPRGSLGAKYMITNNMAIRAALGFANSSGIGTGYGVAGGFEYHFGGRGGVSPYVGGELSYSGGSPSAGSAQSQFGLNGVFGAEYFFSSNFSWAGELQLGFLSSASAGTTTTTIGTGQALFILTWYIN